MAELIAIVGPPGRGKSTSLFPNPELKIQGLDINKTVVINISGKSPSMKGWKKVFTDKPIKEGGNYKITHDPKVISQILQFINDSRLDIENVVIEDAQYLMGFATMERAKEKGYDKWCAIADIGFEPVNKAKDLTRDNLFIWFIYHEEKAGDGEGKIKTAGKMVDDVITLEGLFNTVLFTRMKVDALTKKHGYYFITNADGECKARSKYGTFDKLEIPNDAGYVKESIIKYNEGE